MFAIFCSSSTISICGFESTYFSLFQPISSHYLLSVIKELIKFLSLCIRVLFLRGAAVMSCNSKVVAKISSVFISYCFGDCFVAVPMASRRVKLAIETYLELLSHFGHTLRRYTGAVIGSPQK